MEGAFRVGAAQMEWEVSFRCPGCGEVIFPEDASGRYYSLLGVKIEDREMREAFMKCAKCGSLILLESFDMLNRLGYSHESGDLERRSTNIAVEAGEVPPLSPKLHGRLKSGLG